MKKSKKIVLTMIFACISCLMLFFAVACGGNKVQYNFETNGGTAIASVEVEEGKEFTLPIPQRDGYAFDGWYLTENFSGDSVEQVVAAESATYYAKWSKLAEITLELDGGAFSATSVSMRVGGNVYDYMLTLGAPTKSGVTFGAWFNGNAELKKNLTMPEAGLTLTAKYKVGYLVEIYEQVEGEDRYVKSEEVVEGSDYVGKDFTSELTRKGFTEVITADTVNQKVLSANAAENVFKHYFNRAQYTVTFLANYPDGSTGESQAITVVYGQSIEVPSDFQFEGYCLVGYSLTTDGEVLYKANSIGKALYNGGASQAESFIPEENMVLCAIWSKGYTDLFGGNDYLFLISETSGETTTRTLYLLRGGIYFKADSVRNNLFVFNTPDGLLEGKLNDDGTYSYLSNSRNSFAATLFVNGVGLNRNVTLTFDYYNGITYLDGTKSSTGTYVIGESEDYGEEYYVTFTDGDLAGQNMTMIFGTSNGENAFQIRCDEDLELGTIYRFGVYNNALAPLNSYEITLNGYGVATLNAGGTNSNYFYSFNEDRTMLTLLTQSGSLYGTVKLSTVNNYIGYLVYNEALDHTYTFSGSQNTLVLDGMVKAVYTAGAKVVEGFYTAVTSYLGGTIIEVTAQNETYTFIVNETEKQVTDDNGQTSTVSEYTAQTRANGYAEYYYHDADGTYYGPLLVMNEREEKTATLYGFVTETRTYEKVSVGTITLDNRSGLYLYTAETYFTADDVAVQPIDLSQVKAAVFSTDVVTAGQQRLRVHYWHSMTDKGGATENYTKQYLPEDDSDSSLTFVASFAIYKFGNNVYTGSYQEQEGLTVVTTSEGYLLFELNQEGSTFIRLSAAPYTAYAADNGMINRNITLAFDGKGGAIYTEQGEGDEQDTVYNGTVIRTDEYLPPEGYYIFVFTSSDGQLTFKFIQRSNSSTMYFFRLNEEFSGVYAGPDDSRLTLDGYGYVATYTDEFGRSYSNYYSIPSDNTVRMVVNGSYRYFDLKENKTFTLRGVEYGSYLLLENQTMGELMLTLDGYGHLTVGRSGTDDDGQSILIPVDENGTYVFSDDGRLTLKYTDGNAGKTLVCRRSAIQSGNNIYNILIIIHEEAVRTYVNDKDWSVFVLNEVGNVTKYNREGVIERGTYELITENLLYYVNNAGTDAAIYRYDTEKGTVTPFVLSARGYYTEELNSLLFSRYGFAIIDGETRYYYSVEENGDVIIYRRPEVNETANRYGFYAHNIGVFTDEIEWEGKTYISNNGFDLVFNRVNASKDKYPVRIEAKDDAGQDITVKAPLEQLTFTPSGTLSFRVSGLVMINGENYNCTVTRMVDEGGNVEMYVTVGYFRFGISVSYLGVDEHENSLNTYEVTSLTYLMDLPSNTYLSYYALFYMYFGQSFANSFPNTYGTIQIIREYDEAGEIKADGEYILCEFGANSGIIDVKGNLISSIKVDKADYVFNDKTGIYDLKFTAEDGYHYHLYFQLTANRQLGTYCYAITAFTREQTFETDNGYTVTVERLIASDSQNARTGNIYKINLYHGDDEIEMYAGYLVDGGVYFIERTVNEETDLIERTTYYIITFIEDIDETLGDEVVTVAAYKSANVSVEEITTYYSADEKSYADISASSGVKMFFIGRNGYMVESSEYDAETSTYTVVTTADRKYTIQIVEGKIVITQVIEESPEDIA